MAFLISLGRFLMFAWVVYAPVLIFAPNLVQQQPNQKSGIIQAVSAFILGNLLDRALGAVRRRRADRPLDSSTPEE